MSTSVGRGMDEDIVDRIYEAGAMPELWMGVLEEVGRIAGAVGATLIVPGLGRWLATPGVAETVAELVGSGFIATNERTVGLVAKNHPGFVTDQDLFSLDAIADIPAYRDFFIPRGGGFGVATVISSPSGDTMIFHAERAFADGPVEAKAVRTLDALRPHLARASLFSTRIELQRATAAAAALEILGLPGAVLGGGGRMMFGNGLLGRLVPSVIQDRLARIALTNAAADLMLADAIARLDSDRGNQPVASIPVPARDDQPPVIVHLVPIRGAAQDVFSGATAILVATPVIPRDVPTAEVVQGLFDLTPAEARVAREIGRGKSIAEIVAASGVSDGTVRTQVKAILGKTGLHRQGDLIGLLRGVSSISSL